MAYQETEQLPFLLDALYCEDECFIGEQEEEEDEVREERFFPENIIINRVLSEHDYLWEDSELCTLFSKEQGNEFDDVLEINPSVVKSRKDAVDWILKVVSYYSFSVQTALLAVNYLDGFLFSLHYHSQTQKPWTSQLAAVACLSLAAKVEEIQVPLLLDFQVVESKYVFEAKTIQRMELLILSYRQWKMNPVTPFSFLDYIARRLGLKDRLCFEFLSRCEGVLLSIIPDCRFNCYRPSVIASATMLHVFSRLQPCIGEESQEQLFSILGINKEKIEECHMLIKKVESRKNFGLSAYCKRKFGIAIAAGSPKGVMDYVSFSSSSSEGSNDSWASVSSSPEPLSKRTRNITTTTINYSSIDP